MSGRLLLVDDDPSVRRSLSEGLTEEGYEVRSASSAEEALSLLAESPRPDLVLSDVRMPGLGGMELLELIRERAPGVDVVLMTAYDDMPTVVRAMREGALDFLVKPLDLDELLQVLERAFRDRRAKERGRREAEETRETYRVDAMVGRDPKMLELFKRVGQLAASPVPPTRRRRGPPTVASHRLRPGASTSTCRPPRTTASHRSARPWVGASSSTPSSPGTRRWPALPATGPSWASPTR